MNILKKILLLIKIKKAISKLIKEEKIMKHNYFSTEFILSVLSILALVWSAVQGSIDPALVAKVVAIITAIYTIARTVAKITPTLKDDEFLKKIAELFSAKKPN